LQTSLAAALPVAYALQNNTDAMKLQRVRLDLEAHPEKKQMHIEDVWTSRRQVRPGEQLEIMTLLAGAKGQEITHKVTWDVPIGAPIGPLNITVADGPSANAAEFLHLNLTEPRPASQLITMLNDMRGNTRAYVRIWRSEPAFLIQGSDFPDPPPSLALILGRGTSGAPAAVPRTSTLAELPISVQGLAVAGSRTIQVEIKE
jgi:hypothetical protein